ncbi:hypothetical protein IAQ61_007617 [Plenodomus lingam]|uniref:Uncharacterized protein n=1 Tax=Leptosphaeria maculans (strain JN3 / isolate v23.1.3 / race Av1-4-5-6-7-8) TaxID=985895 RepID=E5A565_LEPMJ|nr:hypothetical protein LEMA_P080020.1 [Plenodomus lingam JN3]KAH9867026.1 hypothetical protein IAQ61_007617 [Plenodomus lingam]CBX98763.1 hypothetical protein LEMA_P080020.1 [Plenodomus lingam JN3]
METITNIATNAASTASKLIYGEQPKDAEARTDLETKTANNETGGKEPLSGEQGKGTAAEPYDQGNVATPLATSDDKSTFLDYKNNGDAPKESSSGEQNKPSQTASTSNDDFLKLNPVLDGPQPDSKTQSSGDPKIYTSRDDATYSGMPIVPLNPDSATSGTNASTSTPSAIGTSTSTDKAGVTDKLWKDTPLDDISRAGAPGAGPTAPAHVTPAVPDSTTSSAGSSVAKPDTAVKTAAPDSVTAASNTYSTHPSQNTSISAVGDVKDSKDTTENTPAKTTPTRDGTPSWTDTGVPAKVEPSTSTDAGACKSIAEDSHGRKSEADKSSGLTSSPSNEEKSGKMSHLKEKLKDKLHIGSKDK